MCGACWLNVCAPRAPQVPAPVAEGPGGDALNNPLFPEFGRLGGGSGGGGGPGPQQGNGDAKRYDRWTRLLPTGAVPSDRVVLYWAMTWPTGNPLFTPTSTWSHILQSGQPKGILIKFGTKKGSMHIWLTKGGRIHISASPKEREMLLQKVLAWTEPYNNGQPPVQVSWTPPLPPVGWNP